MKVIMLLGAPGAGKGTAAEGVKVATPYLHISTGDMLREAVKKSTQVGRQVEQYMKKGELVPDEIMIRLVEERLDSGLLDAAYMFDGFPRTIEQAKMLDASLQRRKTGMGQVFYLVASRELLILRLTGRRICRKCGANYHVTNIPPRVAGVCDVCSGELYQRIDDQEQTILKRLEVFAQQTENLISYYEQQKILVRIDASQPREIIIDTIVRILKGLPAAV